MTTENAALLCDDYDAVGPDVSSSFLAATPPPPFSFPRVTYMHTSTPSYDLDPLFTVVGTIVAALALLVWVQSVRRRWRFWPPSSSSAQYRSVPQGVRGAPLRLPDSECARFVGVRG